MDKKGNWNADFAFNLDNLKSDLLDDKMAKNIVGDLKKNIPPGGFPSKQLNKYLYFSFNRA